MIPWIMPPPTQVGATSIIQQPMVWTANRWQNSLAPTIIRRLNLSHWWTNRATQLWLKSDPLRDQLASPPRPLCQANLTSSMPKSRQIFVCLARVIISKEPRVGFAVKMKTLSTVVKGCVVIEATGRRYERRNTSVNVNLNFAVN